MSPGVQEGNYFYPTELNDYTTCPTETNSGLRYDPNYVQQSTTAFSTDLYSVYTASGVYSMLLTQPDYYYYVPNSNSLLKSVNLYAWQRPTPYWNITCEMTREQAAIYYSQ